MAVPKKVSERLIAGLKQFQPILASARSRDVNEADTVTIVKDMLADVFGYDKYTEITSEYAIRGNYCDLAIKLGGAVATLIEVKAIGLELKHQHVKQAVDYAANQGVDWVLLTNGVTWKVYRIQFTKPIEQELVVEIDFSSLSHRAERDLDVLYLWCKEGWVKSALGDYHTQKQALSRYFLGAVILSDTVVEVVRRELRRLSPDVRIETAEIREVLIAQVLKREVLEGEKADHARKKASRAAGTTLRSAVQKPKTGLSTPESLVEPSSSGGAA
jgi:predicted type IV restriction endonuclease